MNKKMDEILYDSLKPENAPDGELNRRILDRRSKRVMKKKSYRKIAIAAALGCVVVMGGVSAYAATQNISLLSLFADEGKEVRDNAKELLDTQVQQKTGSGNEQSRWAHFQIKEAICDRNQVLVQVEVKAADAEKYLLIPGDMTKPEEEPVSNLNMDGLTGKQSVAEYAESLGKECLRVEAGVFCDAGIQSIQNTMDENGTLYYNIRFDNKEKRKKLDYVCSTYVYPPEGVAADEGIENEISFTLTDKSDVELVRYLPVSDGKVAGTKLVLDEIAFEKSSLDMVCTVKYHYTGSKENAKTQKKWLETREADMAFFMLDEDGNIIETKEGGGSTFPDEANKMEQSMHYAIGKLPDTISFQVKDVFEKELFGTVDVQRAE